MIMSVTKIAGFTTPLITEYIDGVNWKVHEPFTFYFYHKDGKILCEYEDGCEKQYITSNVGDTTDFASIPKWLHSIWSPTGDHGKAAVIHDKIYRTPALINEATGKSFTKEDADLLFLIGMEILGVSWFKREAFYYAVKFGGNKAWESNR